MKNMGQLMQQAQQMQVKMAALQKELDAKIIETSTGGGAVKVKMNGKQEIIEIKISPECVDSSDVEMLQELVKTAVNQATSQSKEMVSNAMSKITGGLGLPGF